MTPAQIGYSILGILYLIFTYFAVSGMFPVDPKDGLPLFAFSDVRISGLFMFWGMTTAVLIIVAISFFIGYMNDNKLWHKKLW